jgi:hypothetical protein
VSGSLGWKAFIGIEITGRLNSKSFEAFKRDIERVAKRYGLRVKKLKLKGGPTRTKKTKKKK